MFISGTSIAFWGLFGAANNGSESNVKEKKVVFSRFLAIVNNNLFSHLSLLDISNLSKTCRTLYHLIADNDVIAKLWFLRLSTEQQTQFELSAAEISEGELRSWIYQFAGS